MFLILLLLVDFLVNIKEISSIQIFTFSYLSSSGRRDYVLLGESFTIACVPFVTSKEKLMYIELFKDDQQVYFNSTNFESRISGVLKDMVLFKDSSFSMLYIKQATLKMHGKYTCKFTTDKETISSVLNLIVIKDACTDKDWEIKYDMISCTGEIRFDCHGIFPMPASSCGIYNLRLDKYLFGKPFVIIKLDDGTYEVSIEKKYSIQDYKSNLRDLSFKCDVVIPGTTWRRSVNFPLLSGKTCDPFLVENGEVFFNSEKTCWNTYREGTSLSLKCNHNYTLIGFSELTCFDGEWIPFINSKIHQISYCNFCPNSSNTYIYIFIIFSILNSINLALLH